MEKNQIAYNPLTNSWYWDAVQSGIYTKTTKLKLEKQILKRKIAPEDYISAISVNSSDCLHTLDGTIDMYPPHLISSPKTQLFTYRIPFTFFQDGKLKPELADLLCWLHFVINGFGKECIDKKIPFL